MKTVGITACSNALRPESRERTGELLTFLKSAGVEVHISPCIYRKEDGSFYTGKERAQALMDLFSDPRIEEIYDISGGDMGNEVLDYLDFQKIRESRARFWGYSDLTTVLNAIYTKSGKTGVLFQMQSLADETFGEIQRRRYQNEGALFSPELRMLRGDCMEGVLIGGNIRCFLKLAGTPYFPDPREKILLLEARSGQVPQMVTYLSQLKSMGVLGKIRGILLGTFTEMEREKCVPDMLTLTKQFTDSSLPIAGTRDIGHGADAAAVFIGEKIRISRQQHFFAADCRNI